MADKPAVARHLDALGVDFIEGGRPGALAKDTEFLARSGELDLRPATLVAFGAPRQPGLTAAADPRARALLYSQAPVVTLVVT